MLVSRMRRSIRGHRKQETGRGILPVSCDYLYIIKNGIFAREELSEEESEAFARVLVTYCSSSHTPFAKAYHARAPTPKVMW